MQQSKEFYSDFTILLPCLNEVETLPNVLKKCLNSISKSSFSGTIIVADNGSTDGSKEYVVSQGIELIEVSTRGYGAALLAGIQTAKSKFVVMADADDSYDLDNIEPFLLELNAGCDLVVGNRFRGGIAPGAMPFLHKFLGNPILSWLGKLFFQVPVDDFHCGMRGFGRKKILSLDLRAPGMEFASEMLVKAKLHNLRIKEIPTRLFVDGRTRAPHLRTWRDGWRHLVFLLSASPRWLFLYPGLFFLTLGMLITSFTAFGNFSVFGIELGVHAFLVGISVLLVGIETCLLALIARAFAGKYGFLPENISSNKMAKAFTLERGVVLGFLLILLGLGFLIALFSSWQTSGYKFADFESSFRLSGAIILFIISGLQVLFASFLAAMVQS